MLVFLCERGSKSKRRAVENFARYREEGPNFRCPPCRSVCRVPVCPGSPGVFLRYSSERVESMVESAPRQGLSTGSGSALGGLLLF
jgi:hypothetical protein